MPNTKNYPVRDDVRHELLEFLWDEMKHENISVRNLSTISGVSADTIRNWKNAKIGATVTRLDRVLRALGYKLAILPMTEKEQEEYDRQQEAR